MEWGTEAERHAYGSADRSQFHRSPSFEKARNLSRQAGAASSREREKSIRYGV